MKTITMLVDLSGSGKSTWAKEHYDNSIIISSDQIRKEILSDAGDQTQNDKVFKEYYKRLKCNMAYQSDNIILDATNITLKSRREALNIVKDSDWKINALIFNVPYLKCVEHDNMREAQNKRYVGEDVIKRQRARFQIPFYEEGFDNIRFVSKQLSESKYLSKINDDMSKFSIGNPHHKIDNLYEHCARVCEALGLGTLEMQLAALYHDYGNLFTKIIDENSVSHYYNHANVGAYELMCDDGFFATLLFADILDILFYINYHMLPFGWNTEKALNKAIRIFGEEKVNNLKLFNEADKKCS